MIVKTDCETDGSSAALNGVLLGDARHGESIASDVLGGDEVEHHLVLLVGDRHQVDQAPERGAWTLADIEAEFHLGRKSSILAITINLQYVDIYPHFQSSILKLREPCCKQTLQQFLILFNILFSHSI